MRSSFAGMFGDEDSDFEKMIDTQAGKELVGFIAWLDDGVLMSKRHFPDNPRKRGIENYLRGMIKQSYDLLEQGKVEAARAMAIKTFLKGEHLWSW